MHAQALLTQANLASQRRALAALVALVLGAHLWLLLAPGASIWRLQPESQKLGPLQTRVLSSGVSQAPPQSPATEQPRPPIQQKPRPPASASATLPSSAGMSAVASEVLPAPEEDLNPTNSDPDTGAFASLPTSCQKSKQSPCHQKLRWHPLCQCRPHRMRSQPRWATFRLTPKLTTNSQVKNGA